MGNLSEFTKYLVHSRFQFGLEQCVNIYIKFRDGPGLGHTLSLTKQEWFSVIPKDLLLLCLTWLQWSQKFIFFSPKMQIFTTSPGFQSSSASGRVLCHWSFLNIRLRKGEERGGRCSVCCINVGFDKDVASSIVFCSLYRRVGTMSSVYHGPHLTPSHWLRAGLCIQDAE